MLTGMAAAAVRQASLLPQHGSGEKSERLMHAMDKLNQIYGAIPFRFLGGHRQVVGHAPGRTYRPATPQAGVMCLPVAHAD
jgi:hypothetical protein